MEGNFSERTRDVIAYSREEAVRLGHDHIGVEHLLLGLLRVTEGNAVKILIDLGCDPAKLKKAIEDTVRETGGRFTVGNIPLTKTAEKVLKITYLEAKLYESDVIDTEHLLLSLLREDNNVAAQILQQGFSVSYDAVRAALDAIVGREPTPPRIPQERVVKMFRGTMHEEEKQQSRLLRMYSRDLTEKARHDLENGMQIVGRVAEREAVARVVCSGRKHALLIGSEGVGKTAVVEGLAQAILRYDVPEALFDHQIIELDLHAILAETPEWFRMEQRIRAIMEAQKNSERLILFIRDLNASVSLRTAHRHRFFSMLHYVLKRAAFPCICTASMARYDGFLQPFAQLDRGFQVITVAPPTDAETLAVVTMHRPHLEARHPCAISDEALEAAVELSGLYLPDQHAPGRAVHLLEEAGSWAFYQQERERVRPLKAILAGLQADLNKTKAAKRKAVKGQRFEEAATLRDEQKNLEATKAEAIDTWRKETSDEVAAVDAETVCQALSHLTGIDVERIRAREAAPSPSEAEEEAATDVMGKLTKAVEDFLAAVRRASEEGE